MRLLSSTIPLPPFQPASPLKHLLINMQQLTLTPHIYINRALTTPVPHLLINALVIKHFNYFCTLQIVLHYFVLINFQPDSRYNIAINISNFVTTLRCPHWKISKILFLPDTCRVNISYIKSRRLYTIINYNTLGTFERGYSELCFISKTESTVIGSQFLKLV